MRFPNILKGCYHIVRFVAGVHMHINFESYIMFMCTCSRNLPTTEMMVFFSISYFLLIFNNVLYDRCIFKIVFEINHLIAILLLVLDNDKIAKKLLLKA